MNSVLTQCPVCQGDLTITRLHCSSCDTQLEGRFTAGPLTGLRPEQLEFIRTFIRCEGKLTRMEQELGLSYPTIRNRLHEVIRALGYEPGKDESADLGDDRRRSVLEELDSGKISADDAMRILRGQEE